MDDRPTHESVMGIQLPGGSSGVIDALKVVLGISEDEAWQLTLDKGIPMGAHDDDRLGANGCGYNNLVETNPAAVGAPESATAAARLARVPTERVLHSLGDHAPVHAVINYVSGRTLDTDRVFAAGSGAFSLDAWALTDLAATAGLSSTTRGQFVDHIVDSYQRAVLALAGDAIRDFISLR